MHITIATVGKLRERYWDEAAKEYLKRLTRYAEVNVVEVAEEQAPETLSPAERETVKAREGERLLKQIRPDAHVIALVIEGKQLSSEALSAHLADLSLHGQGEVAIIIGGSLGLSPAVTTRAQQQLSFGKLTYPHQLMRVILLEQVYRAFKIMRGEPYHK